MQPPPELGSVATAISDASHLLFRLVNRVMVPMHRAGVAAWLGNPLTGWQCLLTTTGRRSGQPRRAPLGYVVMDGATWVMAGYGPKTRWFRNILVEPRVCLQLPGRAPLEAIASEVQDAAVRARVIPPLTRSMALPGAMIGCIPALSSDERILGCVSFVPLVRIAAADGTETERGPDDPGGSAWIWRQMVVLAAGSVVALITRAVVRSPRSRR